MSDRILEHAARARRAAVAAALSLLALPAVAAAELPSAASGQRPGPDALYAPPPEAPQLENRAPWRAEPILVSGAHAYRDGEWLYQDFLYDDHGAAGAKDPGDPYDAGAHLFSPTAGTLTYPRNPDVYGYNAADLVELRVRPLAAETAFRVTLNTLKDPERTAFTIALGGSGPARAWPHGAGVSSPAERFVTVHGSTAELRDAATGQLVEGGASAAVDVRSRQVDVRVPHSAWSPAAGTHRITIGVGLWDGAAGRYLAPAHEATEERPGGVAPSRAALFNVGPRLDEPFPDVDQLGGGVTFGDAAAGATVQAAWWRERAQADALRLGDVSAFGVDVDFGKLAAGVDDESGVPSDGPIDRIFASRHEVGQGLDPSRVCFDLGARFSAGAECEGRFVGRLQTYGLYVPRKPRPARGWGVTLLLHSLSANQNQYMASRNQSQLGERGAGSLVATPGGRGPDGFYAGLAEADAFEVWADLARHYELDPSWAAVSGYSMGGFGTYRLLARYPDLFGRGMSTVGAPGSVSDQLLSLRNTPVMAWNAVGDELVNVNSSEQAIRDMTAAGLRFVHWTFPGADHLTLATNDEYAPAADFLAEHRADRAPPHVTYVVDPREDARGADVVGDHAYWLSGLRVRDERASPTGTVDARSEMFGVGDPPALPAWTRQGTLEGGSHGPMPYVERNREWGAIPRTPKRRELELRARNLSRASVDARRSRVGCAPLLRLETDGPLALALTDCRPRRARATCTPRVGVGVPRIAGAREVSVRVRRGRRTLGRARGARVRRVAARRPTRRAFTAVTTLRATVGGHPVTVTSRQRVGGCGG